MQENDIGRDRGRGHVRQRAFQEVDARNWRWPDLQEDERLVVPLLEAAEAAAESDQTAMEDAALIDQELRGLFRARALFLRWVEKLRAGEGKSDVSPTQFLRAWNNSTTRVIQLLRARQALCGAGEEGPYERLADRVYDTLEAYVREASLEEARWQEVSRQGEGEHG